MKSSNLHLIICFFFMLYWSQSVAGVDVPMPEKVFNAGPTARFLWHFMADGTFYVKLPPNYAQDEAAWRRFLDEDGLVFIRDYME